MVGIDTTRRLTAAACFLSLLQLGDRIGNRTVKGCLGQVFRGVSVFMPVVLPRRTAPIGTRISYPRTKGVRGCSFRDQVRMNPHFDLCPRATP